MDTHTIQVWINQVETTLKAPAYLADAIQTANIQPPFAAAVNLQFVPKKNYHVILSTLFFITSIPIFINEIYFEFF